MQTPSPQPRKTFRPHASTANDTTTEQTQQASPILFHHTQDGKKQSLTAPKNQALRIESRHIESQLFFIAVDEPPIHFCQSAKEKILSPFRFFSFGVSFRSNNVPVFSSFPLRQTNYCKNDGNSQIGSSYSCAIAYIRSICCNVCSISFW